MGRQHRKVEMFDRFDGDLHRQGADQQLVAGEGLDHQYLKWTISIRTGLKRQQRCAPLQRDPAIR